ncbi:MAG: glycoside hydrolase family 16 protein [Cyclobacteriaceae bacterium]
MKLRFLQFILFFGLIACTEPDSEQKLTLPAGLEFEIIYGQAGSGLIEIKSSASLTNFFSADFGDGSKIVNAVSGEFSHRYEKSGSYKITVRAHITTDQFISAEQNIGINIDPIFIPNSGATSPLSYPGRTLVWQDEFDGSELNLTNWTYDLGTGNNGWGNNELQYYRTENASLYQGYLVITAKKEAYQGKTYTSSRIKTAGLRSFQYGRVDVRAVVPEGQGLWAAAWMLGNNIGTVSWPRCGEIDIMEVVGGQGREKTVLGTVHWDNNGTYATFGATRTNSTPLNEQFHVYSIEWNEQSIRWYLDDVQYHVIDITPAELNEFQKSFFMILNLAVGGNLPGSPNESTTFPKNLIVDYVRYFQ